MSKDFKRFFYKKTVVEEGDTIWTTLRYFYRVWFEDDDR